MAIMGASGAGKTTLLNVLAGRLPAGAASAAPAAVLFNGLPAAHYMRRGAVAYVEQRDALLPCLTVRDTLRFAARLRLPRTLTRAQKHAAVEQVILELGLKDCADALVGGDGDGDGTSGGGGGGGWRKNGISGGERRRVSIGVQLLLNPSIIFLDEPTTGLDAFSARSLVETLKQLCRRGRTIVLSIHQPRSDIFAAFDRVTLLARPGRVAFSGLRAAAVPFFESAGAPHPRIALNPADFLDSTVDLPTSKKLNGVPRRRLADRIVDAWAAATAATARPKPSSPLSSPVDLPRPSVQTLVDSIDLIPPDAVQTTPAAASSPLDATSSSSRFADSAGAPFAEQLCVLTERALKNLYDDRITLYGSVGEVVVVAAAIGYIYFRLDDSAAGVLSRKALLLSCCGIQNQLGLLFIIWKLTDSEMVTFDRERSDKLYSVLAYLISWFAANFFLYAFLASLFSTIVYFMTGLRLDDMGHHFGVFVAGNVLMQFVTLAIGFFCVSINRSFATASLIGNTLFTLFNLSSGFFIPVNAIPVFLRWLQHVGYITHGYTLLVTNEFSGNSFRCDGAGCDGDTVVRDLGFVPGDIKGPAAALAITFAVLMVVAGVLLAVVPQRREKQARKVKPTRSAAAASAAHAAAGEAEDKASIAGAAAEAHGSGVTLELRDVSLTIKGVKRGPVALKPILQLVSAVFEPGTVTAILGPSGAGKSTLLHLLHGHPPQLPSGSAVVLRGEVLYNGAAAITPTEIASHTSLVRQDDTHLQPGLTARETLRYAALLRLPAAVPEADKLLRAESVLRELGLAHCADTLVGGPGAKGLSGGERRRLSVGIALLSDPAVLLLDEPTSGLDATAARNLVLALKALAQDSRRTVVCTIHQPRSDIFAALDSCLLLAPAGRPIFCGPADALLPHLAAALDLPAPPHLTNPADFALDAAAVDTRYPDSEAASRKRVDALVAAWKRRLATTSSDPLGNPITPVDPLAPTTSDTAPQPQPPTRHGSRLPVLVARSATNLKRQPGLVATRLIQIAAFMIVLTLFFARLGTDQDSVAMRIGLSQLLSSAVLIGMMNCIAVFRRELMLFRYEHADAACTVSDFFWTYTVNEVPFEIAAALLSGVLVRYAIGLQIDFPVLVACIFAFMNAGESIGIAFCSFVDQPGVSVQVMSVIIGLMGIMQGFLSIKMPAPLTYLNYLSIMRYGARAMAHQSFANLRFSCDSTAVSCTYPSGDAVLATLGFPAADDAAAFHRDPRRRRRRRHRVPRDRVRRGVVEH
ncbi:P-loop containing nucleoside triphosphate hydrolase protein [Zopfochytrium polystomum]|nr:P-loop containing nucleoside triphosphate hydrolase protein [Zopfochytrium polystomum]